MEEVIEIKAASWQGIPEDEALQKTRDRQRREFTEDDTLSKTTLCRRRRQTKDSHKLKKIQKKKIQASVKTSFCDGTGTWATNGWFPSSVWSVSMSSSLSCMEKWVNM